MSPLESVLTGVARKIAARRGIVLLRTVKVASHNTSNFIVRDNSPYIFIGNRAQIVPELGRVLESAVGIALELDCPGGQYLLHDGTKRIAL